MDKSIEFSQNSCYQPTYTASSTLNLGLSPISTTECSSTDNLSSLITLPPLKLTNFNYSRINQVNQPKGYCNYYYKLPPIRQPNTPDTGINLPSIYRLIGPKASSQIQHQHQHKPIYNSNKHLHKHPKLRTNQNQNQNKCNSGIIVITNNINKRPRRKYNEIDRKYTCNFSNCDKAYGALNHLNSHIVFSNHGNKRKAKEFY